MAKKTDIPVSTLSTKMSFDSSISRRGALILGYSNLIGDILNGE